MQKKQRFQGLLGVLAFGGLFLTGTPASAQENMIREADRVEYHKKTLIDFSDVNVEGELTKPEGSYIKNRKRTNFRVLIELRGHFRNELRRSVDAL